MTRYASILTTILLAVLLWGACSPTAVPESPFPETTASSPMPVPAESVERLRLPGGGYWGHPSPFGFNRGPGYVRAALLFDTLVWRDASGETIPWLATDWQMSADGLTWTFTLRDGVRWHDGQPLTVDDVVFTVKYLQSHPGIGWFMARTDEIESAVRLSDNQVALRLERPFAPFLATIAEPMFIIPRHIWETVTDPKTFAEPGAFVGSGAYRLVEYSQAEGTYLFEANPDFFLGQPYVRRIEFIPVSDNILALQNGAIDAFDKFGGVTGEMLEMFRQEPFVVGDAPGEWGMFLYFNLEKDTPLQDVRVRQAIAYAVDRQALVERVLFGVGSPGSPGFLPPANAFYNAAVPAYARDPQKARLLLREAGYDGTPLRLAYSPDWIMASARVVEIVEANLAEVGIPLVLVTMDQAAIDAAAVAGNYEILLTGFGGLGGDPDQLRQYLASSSQLQGFSRARGYANPDFDRLAEAQVGMVDAAARQQAVSEMQRLLAEDLPVLALYTSGRVVFFNATVLDNWYFTPGGYGGGIPMPYNKHQFIVGRPAGLTIRGTQ